MISKGQRVQVSSDIRPVDIQIEGQVIIQNESVGYEP